ncbi:hypothetical protein BHS07_08655 [Myxococcus xanthus]|uniref:Uncharacterized protein n=1 Tax=Myxococcus xanthus TaxID=34 RepID=A0AAE6KRF3_MYXXA|nr:hypothetical protein BHS09_08775 [Myxococcus xanthus]QDE74363.1 hypothetical protein BHS08_08785 [Myxococcus xanthus]QDE81625.1 hypothetical protein BHS07_08655 [Myxococcus xanthus]QDE95948.1 hypothetical protein BHS05_08785 [Myxococcus xanthus]QDF03288.1 hypothetical protein BHS04_08695 [Myxococcus xanthus]
MGSAFRLPPLLRGDGRDFNRSVAEAQLRFAEDPVFQPERDEFDFLLNRKVLADMGVRFWRFRSQTTATRAPERMTEMVERLSQGCLALARRDMDTEHVPVPRAELDTWFSGQST